MNYLTKKISMIESAIPLSEKILIKIVKTLVLILFFGVTVIAMSVSNRGVWAIYNDVGSTFNDKVTMHYTAIILVIYSVLLLAACIFYIIKIWISDENETISDDKLKSEIQKQKLKVLIEEIKLSRLDLVALGRGFYEMDENVENKYKIMAGKKLDAGYAENEFELALLKSKDVKA